MHRVSDFLHEYPSYEEAPSSCKAMTTTMELRVVISEQQPNLEAKVKCLNVQRHLLVITNSLTWLLYYIWVDNSPFLKTNFGTDRG